MVLLRNGTQGHKAYEGVITEGKHFKDKECSQSQEDNPFEGLAIIELSQTWNQRQAHGFTLILTRCNRVCHNNTSISIF